MNDLGGSSGPHTSPPSAFHGRSSYPVEALDWLLPTGTPRVLDLGAGTGRLTRQLVARGIDVVAVDPSAAMLAELRRNLPGVPTQEGVPDAIPLPDHSVDVVVMAEAWHWADPSRVLPEVARVLTPGGRLGLLWNVRDERTAWVARLGTVIGGADLHRDPRIGPPFLPADRAAFEWARTVRPDQLIDLVAARSRMILLPSDERAAALAQVRQLMATHPDLLGRGSYHFPYVTECARADLLTRHPRPPATPP